MDPLEFDIEMAVARIGGGKLPVREEDERTRRHDIARLMDEIEAGTMAGSQVKYNYFLINSKIVQVMHLLKEGGVVLEERDPAVARLNKCIVDLNTSVMPEHRLHGTIMQLTPYRAHWHCMGRVWRMKCSKCGSEWNCNGNSDLDLLAPKHCTSCESPRIFEIDYVHENLPDEDTGARSAITCAGMCCQLLQSCSRALKRRHDRR